MPTPVVVTPQPASKVIDRHPVLRFAYGYIAGGVVHLAFAAVVLVSFELSIGWISVLPALCGAGLIGLGLHLRSTGAALQIISRAYNLVSTGHLCDAEALLNASAASLRTRYARLAVETHRALLAMRRGELTRGIAHADAAIAMPEALAGRIGQSLQRTGARAIRALLRASAGERESALADIEAVRADPIAPPESLARVEVARAVILERAGDREALRDHLTRERRLLLEFTHLRERALVRAYQRLLKAPKTSAYRTSAPREQEPSEEPALADWAAKIAPAAAPFVRTKAPTRAKASAASAATEAIDPASRAAAEGRFKKLEKQGWGLLIAIGIGIVLPAVSMWHVVSLAMRAPIAVDDDWSPPQPPSPLVQALPPLIMMGLMAFAIGLVVVQSRRANAVVRRFFEVSADRARGDDAAATQALNELAASRMPPIAAQAHLLLAEDAERRAELTDALAACEAGLGRLQTQYMRAFASDVALPGLLAERAYLFVATDRPADARAELALLQERHPTYAFLDHAKLRVALLQKARQGELAAAAELAEHAADLPLNARDELLADLVRVAAAKGSASQAEVARLREELAIDAGARRWVEAMAPGVLPAFQRAVEAEVAEEAEAASASASENEALAEAEAAREAEGGRLARA